MGQALHRSPWVLGWTGPRAPGRRQNSGEEAFAGLQGTGEGMGGRGGSALRKGLPGLRLPWLSALTPDGPLTCSLSPSPSPLSFHFSLPLSEDLAGLPGSSPKNNSLQYFSGKINSQNTLLLSHWKIMLSSPGSCHQVDT